jgi:hypothetical protein
LDFKSEIEIINQNTSEEDKRGIHFKSLCNFVYQYNSFKKGKIKATELLTEYIELIKEQNFTFTEEQSKATFDLYINPIAHFYKRSLNFSSKLTIDLILLFFSVPNICVWFIFHSKIISFFVLLLSIAYWINYSTKYYRKKIYGYRY